MRLAAVLFAFCAACAAEGEVIEVDEALTGCAAVRPAAVVASGDDGNVAANTLDGDPSTRWSALGVGSWIRYDLGADRSVCAVRIDWYRGDTRTSNHVIQRSLDGVTWFTGSTGDARYVRITVNGNSENDWASIDDVAIDAAPDPAPPTAASLDEDGVIRLFEPKGGGASWRLGTQDLSTVADFDMDRDKTQPITHTANYWTVAAGNVSYSSGGTGKTLRFNIHASGGTQQHTWLMHPAFLSNTRDLKNLEATAYVRVRSRYLTSHQSLSWKIRGGSHSSPPVDGNLASCTQMGVPFGGAPATAARELEHPLYDYITLSSRFAYSVEEDQWLGVKIVSWVNADGQSTTNRLYLDRNPFSASGKPHNDFRLYSTWTDVDGVATQHYSTAATWGGWLTTMRIDGYELVDLAILSAREIVRP